MTSTWTPEQLTRIDESDELEIAARRADGTLWRWTPIWVVRVDGQVYVRTWHRRTSGWFGAVVDSGQARVRVPGLEAGVSVEDVGEGPGELRARVDQAYRAKYARYGDGSVGPMVADAAAVATLRLAPEPDADGQDGGQD
jgi:hypothetical protein